MNQEKCARWCQGAIGPKSADYIRCLTSEAWADACSAHEEAEDIVLGALYPNLADSEELRREFFGFLWGQSDFAGIMRPYRILGRYLETGDILASSFGDMMELIESLEFRGRRAYFAMLRQRLIWKAHHRLRKDKLYNDQLQPRDLADHGAGEIWKTSFQKELRGLVTASVLTLSSRDQELVKSYLQGRAVKEIAQELKLSQNAGSKALRRALARLKTEMEKRGLRGWGLD